MKTDTGVTLRDVAEAAGVHVSTVSRALNPDEPHRVNATTAARVRAHALRLGYRPDAIARGLRRGKTDTVGVVVADLANPFLVDVMRGVENVLEPRDFMPLIAETRDDPANLRRALERLADRRVDDFSMQPKHRRDLDLPTRAARRVSSAGGVEFNDKRHLRAGGAIHSILESEW